MFISVLECGIDGHAQLLAIEPCLEILPGDGRVITGTFRHQVSASISLSIAGQTGSLQTVLPPIAERGPLDCGSLLPLWGQQPAAELTVGT